MSSGLIIYKNVNITIWSSNQHCFNRWYGYGIPISKNNWQLQYIIYLDSHFNYYHFLWCKILIWYDCKCKCLEAFCTLLSFLKLATALSEIEMRYNLCVSVSFLFSFQTRIVKNNLFYNSSYLLSSQADISITTFGQRMYDVPKPFLTPTL